MSAPPEVVVFDLGKVLVDFDYRIASRRIAERSRKNAEQVQALIDHSPLLYRYETGRLTRQEFFEEIVSTTGFAETLAEFSDFFADIFTPIDEMVSAHARLRGHGVPTYIFSNTNDLAVAHIRRNFPFFAQFDAYVLSYEHGAMKPDPTLYRIVEDVTGRHGAQILYLDDRPENVETGRRRGWQIIQHQTPPASIQRLRELGLRV